MEEGVRGEEGEESGRRGVDMWRGKVKVRGRARRPEVSGWDVGRGCFAIAEGEEREAEIISGERECGWRFVSKDG